MRGGKNHRCFQYLPALGNHLLCRAYILQNQPWQQNGVGQAVSVSWRQWEEIAQLQKPALGSLTYRILEVCLQHWQLWAVSFPTQSHLKMVYPCLVPSSQTSFVVSRLKEDEAAGVNKLKINAITKESRKEKRRKKKENSTPVEAKAFNYASCCVETHCTVLLVLFGFDFRFREIKTMDDVWISCLLKNA